ncbi:MAG: ribonucleoside-diphosphate reductase, partial [Firmicutes bacterium]|nr:ribonucleoside-diphosphate reductase [Bacillota bacterium]
MTTLPSLLTRYFTRELEQNPGKTVFDLFSWDRSDVLIKDHKNGRILTDMKDLEFPVHYSQNARDIIASKYFRKAGVKDSPSGGETSMRQVSHRMVNFWVSALREEGILTTDEQAKIVYDELVYA